MAASHQDLAERTRKIVRTLARLYPDTRVALDFGTPLELLIALILAAQFRDDRVNKITPALFARFRSARDYAGADPDELQELLRDVNFFRQKTRAVQACTRALVENFGGEVPRQLDDLLTLPHVGRKTANVLRGNAFGIPAIGVDRHVLRLSQRIGLTAETNPDRVEAALTPIVRPEDQVRFCYLLQAHGRAVCVAAAPRCGDCAIREWCDFGSQATPQPARRRARPAAGAAPARAKSVAAGNAAAKSRAVAKSGIVKSAGAATPARRATSQSGRKTSVPTKARKTSGTRTDPSRS